MNKLNCGRENDLIGFLYGELDPTEKLGFSRHMENCTECSSQLESFTDIRQSVVEWRNESLGAFSSVHDLTGVGKEPRKQSALAALREFFNLSPLWMKGTVAFASLLFCLFAVLAVARFTDNPTDKTIAANANSNTLPTETINAQVERRVQEELRLRAAAENAATVKPNPPDRSRPRTNSSNQLASASSQRKAGRPLSRLERQELAADLGLIDDGSDSELVLIGDRVNQ